MHHHPVLAAERPEDGEPASLREEKPAVAKPLQIIRLGTAEEDFSFNLEKENLDLIMNKVPPGMKVAVVSVVGAFRTGKSFLLTFLLRYLRYGSELDESEDWMTAAGDLREGNINEQLRGSSATESSFQWRAGKERTTTGIWMWSEPFIRRVANGEDVAVLLMDTQGMFDNETSMNLTACIFGLSTLLSSYQIYNVQNRIQEDNLQHLALFSEYGRIALAGHKQDGRARKAAAQAKAKAAAAGGGGEGEGEGGYRAGEGGEEEEEEDDDEMVMPDDEEVPFQRVEFLVRDWMDFDEDAPFHKLREEMATYLQEVMDKASVRDLVQTREQILACFQKVRCFMLPHPGLEVPKKAYTGQVELIHPFFRRCLNHYARDVFGPELEAKRIHKRDLTGPELRQYVVSYVDMFKSGTRFPEAQTMLEATASANNQNARQLAAGKYRSEMDAYVGPKVYEYRKVEEFLAHHRACKDAALKLFDTTANIGRKAQIKEFRAKVLEEIEDLFVRYEEANANRNPFRNFEYYALPLLVAFVAFILRWISDLESTCSLERRYLCTSMSNAMGHIYVFTFTFILILSFNRVKMFVDYVRQVVPVLIGMDRNTFKLKDA